MMLRMYLRWADSHGFQAEVIEASAGEVAGIKSATVRIVVSMRTAGCEPKPACTASLENLLSIPAIAATPRSPAFSCHPR